MRAPPLSLSPITGAPTFIAASITLQIFCAWRSLKRSAEHGEILREDKHQPAVDRARPGDHPVAGKFLRLHAEVDAIMLDVHVDFLERVGVEQHATIARARSAAPWHAAPRCAFRPRPASPPRAALPILRSSSPWHRSCDGTSTPCASTCVNLSPPRALTPDRRTHDHQPAVAQAPVAGPPRPEPGQCRARRGA